ncbi:ABC transporter substrate-binding protein [Ruania albidiflava]|uniref:ABC transporter substrate-binding protein n=1 Tax=Ruania albidiflava TaxID=366586 RepID=UPI0023F17B2C|nr:sugar ABC transporter substrate-binding protein [Ruania albidiflava]
MLHTKSRRTTVAVAGIAASALLLAACSSGTDDGGGGDDAEPIDAEAVAEEGGDLLIWGWGNAMEPMVEGFMDAYPNVNAELVNVGTGTDHYTAVENAIQAGSGIPDVIVMEYQAVAQFALNGTLADLSGYGADQYAETFTTGTWDAVQFDGGIYSLPMSSGPMALFYNQTVFDEHDIEVPQTWEEFLEAGRALKEADPDAYIANDTGSANLLQGLLWQQGYQPYQVEGENVTISFDGPEVQNYTDLWQQLIDEDLLAPISDWSDEWYQGLANGTIATLVSGAWMPANFESGVEGAAGDWRVAPMPQWEEGAHSSAENGGSGLGVVDASDNKDLAYAFVEWATTGDGIDTRLHATFPSTVADLQSEEFLSLESDYFGGQRINEVFAESAANVPEGWSFLPYQVYANSILNDNIGTAYTGDTPLAEGLQSWQDALVAYGQDQGFTVNG